MDMTFKLENLEFEGPLDLLLHLIDKNKVNIYDIPIALITDQYMECIGEMKRHDMAIMSEFMVMAATLLDIKARMLLPQEVVSEDGEEELDPRAELVAQLLEYKMYKYISTELKDRQMDADKLMFREKSLPEEVMEYEQPIDLDELVGDMTLTKLNAIFQSIMRRKEDRVDPVRSKFGSIKKEEVSMEDKIVYLRDYARSHKSFSFRGMLTAASSRVEVIVTFLAILELMKSGTVVIRQDNLFDDIMITSQVAA